MDLEDEIMAHAEIIFSHNDGLCSPIDLRPPFLPAVKTILQGLKIIGIVSGAEEWRGKPLSGLVGQSKIVMSET